MSDLWAKFKCPWPLINDRSHICQGHDSIIAVGRGSSRALLPEWFVPRAKRNERTNRVCFRHFPVLELQREWIKYSSLLSSLRVTRRNPRVVQKKLPRSQLLAKNGATNEASRRTSWLFFFSSSRNLSSQSLMKVCTDVPTNVEQSTRCC